jgi:hypothetical protein
MLQCAIRAYDARPDRSEARVRRAERRACYLCVARERNSYFAHLKDRMVQVQTTLVASPRNHHPPRLWGRAGSSPG